jgi:hypothetical protein
MISGAARRFPACTVKAKPGQIEPIHENIDNPYRVVVADPVFKALWKQGALTAVRPLDKALHQPIPARFAGIVACFAFSHSLAPKRPSQK